jgi:hypothetical protein
MPTPTQAARLTLLLMAFGCAPGGVTEAEDIDTDAVDDAETGEAALRAIDTCGGDADADLVDAPNAWAHSYASPDEDWVVALAGTLTRVGERAVDLGAPSCFQIVRGDNRVVFTASSPCELGDLGDDWGEVTWAGTYALETLSDTDSLYSFDGLDVAAAGERVVVTGDMGLHFGDTVSMTANLDVDLSEAGAVFGGDQNREGLIGTFALHWAVSAAGHFVQSDRSDLRAAAGLEPGTACSARHDEDRAIVGQQIVEFDDRPDDDCYDVRIDGQGQAAFCP